MSQVYSRQSLGGLYQAYIRLISGICPAFLRHISNYIWYISQTDFRQSSCLSCISQAYLWHISDISQAYLRYISGISHISRIDQRYVKQSQIISQTYPRYISVISHAQACRRYIRDTYMAYLMNIPRHISGIFCFFKQTVSHTNILLNILDKSQTYSNHISYIANKGISVKYPI